MNEQAEPELDRCKVEAKSTQEFREAIPEIVVHGETGLLVPPGAPGALAEAMRALLQDPARARAMGAAGRERVRRCFGWDRAVERMTEVLARHRASPAGGAPAHHQPGWTL